MFLGFKLITESVCATHPCLNWHQMCGKGLPLTLYTRSSQTDRKGSNKCLISLNVACLPVLCVSCCNNLWIQMGVFNLPTPAPSLTFLQCKQILVVVVVSIGQRHYGHFNSNYNIRQITATTTNTWHELIQYCQWKVIDGMFWVGGNKYSHFTRMKCYTRKLCK